MDGRTDLLSGGRRGRRTDRRADGRANGRADGPKKKKEKVFCVREVDGLLVGHLSICSSCPVSAHVQYSAALLNVDTKKGWMANAKADRLQCHPMSNTHNAVNCFSEVHFSSVTIWCTSSVLKCSAEREQSTSTALYLCVSIESCELGNLTTR